MKPRGAPEGRHKRIDQTARNEKEMIDAIRKQR
jgi:hypothetical protein